jgi:hypothetical protein
VRPVNLSTYGVQLFLQKDHEVLKSIEAELSSFFDEIKTNTHENPDFKHSKESELYFQEDEMS